MRVGVLGATGSIGRAIVAELRRQGYDTVAFVRRESAAGALPEMVGARIVHVDVADPVTFTAALSDSRCNAVISALASRTGVAADAWAIDHQANARALTAASQSEARHFILVSAICVQRPRLAFQHAKLAFEAELARSDIRYSIVRPTAFFKSLSGQIERIRKGKPFLLFGDGRLTSCKPISDRDLAAYVVGCLTDQDRWNAILPIGGPGAAITPRQQGEMLFALLGRAPRFRSVPAALLRAIALALDAAGRLAPRFAAKAELARIGHYYATESMLVLDAETGRYLAEATPSTGTDTLFDHYRDVLAGSASAERGAHAVF